MAPPKGYIPWNKGLIGKQFHTQKTKDKLRILHLGNQIRLGAVLSDETKEKIRKKRLGFKCSEESKQKMSIARKGKNHWKWKGGLTTNKSYQAFKVRQRYNRKKTAGLHTFGEWETLKAQYNWTCPACGKEEPEIKLTEDHIIPLSKGGSNNIENIQPLCPKCNLRKYIKIIKYSPEGEIIVL